VTAPFERLPPLRGFLTTARGRCIAAYLVVQLVLPAAYYVRRDPHDERFSWRMFSTIRMASCETELRLDDQAIALQTRFHEAWLELARRGRLNVIAAMGQRVCRAHPDHPVTVSLHCKYLDGTTRAFGGFDVCKVSEL
jgi:hypothetical protein